MLTNSQIKQACGRSPVCGAASHQARQVVLAFSTCFQTSGDFVDFFNPDGRRILRACCFFCLRLQVVRQHGMQIQTKGRASHHERLSRARCQSSAVVEEAPEAEASQARPPPKIASNVTELIGNTPMVYLNKVRIVMLCRNCFSTQVLQFSWWTTGGPRIKNSAGPLCLFVSVHTATKSESPLCRLPGA